MARQKNQRRESSPRDHHPSDGAEDHRLARQQRDRRPLPEYSDPVDDTLDDSFPASDPPSWSGLTLGGH
jgi:hypothetical protein